MFEIINTRKVIQQICEKQWINEQINQTLMSVFQLFSVKLVTMTIP